jgi:hypothetical protein
VVSKTAFPLNRFDCVVLRVSHFNDDFSVPDHNWISLHGDKAGRQYNLTRADVELPLMKIALDNVTVDGALRQRSGAVSAMIVGDVEFSLDIEYREFKTSPLDLDRSAGRDVSGAAKLELHSGRRL